MDSLSEQQQTNEILGQATIEQKSHWMRRIGAALMGVNILILLLIGFALVRLDASGVEPSRGLAFLLAILSYVLLSSGLLMWMLRNVRNTSRHQDALRRLSERYQRRREELQVAAQIARDASLGADPHTILQQATQLIYERFGLYHVGIFLLERGTDEREFAILKAAAGADGSAELLDYGYKIAVGEANIIGYVTKSAKARIVLDVRQDPHYNTHPLLPATRAELAVPLHVGTRILGALDVQSKIQGAFRQEDMEILQTLADLLAVAIDKAQLHQQIVDYSDILEKRVTERTRELNVERAQLNAILNAMVEGVIYYEDQRLLYTNKSFTELVGYNEVDWAGLIPVLRIMGVSESDVQQQRTAIYDTVAKDGIWRGELRLRRKNGTEFDAFVTVVSVDSTDDVINGGTVFVIRDISAEKALQEQQARFVSYASHELRTPLANMKTQLYLLQRQPHKMEHHASIMKQVIGRMQRLVDDLLTKSRFERGMIELRRTVTPLRDLVATVVELQIPEAENSQITLTSHLSDNPLPANIDHDRITQVITNLISNAINYTHEGGQITVTLQPHGTDEADIIVTDTGVGIPDDMLELIFQPFIRVENTPAKGTGLGLNITKQIVEMHEGQILVESTLNKGSTFTLRLKLAEEHELVQS